MGKLSFLAGAAAGYVFGTRAGEKRYEQIKKQADKAWSHPAVQDKVTTATEQVKAKAPAVAAAVGQKATDAGKSAGQAVADKAGDAKDAVKNRGDKDLPDTIHRGNDGELHADTSGFGPGGEKLP